MRLRVRVNGEAMNSRLKYALITVLCSVGTILPTPRLPASSAAAQAPAAGAQGQKEAFEQRALAADRAFVEAAAKSDAAALDSLLDARFTWTDASGKTLTRQEFLQQMPKPAITDPNAQNTAHNYGSVESIQIHSDKDHALHVWVNRSNGWRLLVYQEVHLLDTPPTPTPGTRAACENPCKTMPFDPKTSNERDVIAGFQSLQTYTVAHDAKNWGLYVADEFEAANSNSDQTLTKTGRMEDLARSKMAGYTPMPVVEMRVIDLGTAALLISKHQPEQGKPVHITRVWIKRGGHWMEAASYQTRIEDAPAR
jgi:Domain of unknown function (DUF4440)